MLSLALIRLNVIVFALLFMSIRFIFFMQTQSIRIRIGLTAPLVFLLCQTVFVSGAAADTANPNEEYVRQSAFFPSWAEEQDAKERKLEQRLKETLEVLPGIRSAKVHVSLVSRASATTQSSHHPSASIVILSPHPSAVRQDKLKSMVAGAYVGLSESDVRIFVYRPDSQGGAVCNEAANSRPEVNTRIQNDCWKPLIVITVIQIMCAALIVMGVGIYRLLRNRKHRIERQI